MVDVKDPELHLGLADNKPYRPRLKKSISREIVSGTIQLCDLCVVVLSGLIAFWVYLFGVLGDADDFDRYSLTTALAAGVFLFLMRRGESYQFARLKQLGWQIRHIVALWGVTISAFTTWAFLTKVADIYSRGWSISFALLALGGLLLSRVVLRLQFRQWRAQGRLRRSVAIVGAGHVGEELVSKLKETAGDEVYLIGIFDDRLTRVPRSIAGSPVLGTTDRLIELGQATTIDEIIIALPLRAAARIGEISAKLRLLPTDLRVCIDAIADAFPMRGIGSIASIPMIEIFERPLKHWSGVAKTVEDRVLSALCLIAAAPVMAVAAIAIKCDSKGPIFFRQDRFGFNNRPISVLKFRTMFSDRGDPSGARRTVRNDPRVTRVGRVLRQLSLDELPQLINVLRGEMSLVGPRAHAVAMKAGDRLYHEAVGDYLHRHRVLPGITGWAQIHGLRGEIDSLESARERVTYDLHYIDNWSLWLDFKILIRTVSLVFSRNNAY